MPFEDAGVTEMSFLAVFAQPWMADIGGHALKAPDTAALAFTDETLALERLPLVARQGFTGFVETIAVRCLPGCSPNVLCSILGYAELCEGSHQGMVYFRYQDLVREFRGYERIGLPAGAHVQLHRATSDACEQQLPQQRPLREHQQLLTPRAARDEDRLLLTRDESADTATIVDPGAPPGEQSDLSSFMQYSPSPHRSDPDLTYVLQALRFHEAEIGVWLHTWDRRFEWAFLHRRQRISVERSARPQILSQWSDHQVRADAHLAYMPGITSASGAAAGEVLALL